MLTRTVRTIAALTSSICLAAAAVPSISQADTMTVTKHVDASTNVLYQNCTNGQHYATVVTP